MRIAFTTFGSAWPQVCGTQKNAGALAAHMLRDTPSDRERQAARQVRRAAAGFNHALEPTPVLCLFAGRLGEDFDAAFEWIVFVEQDQVRFPPPNNSENIAWKLSRIFLNVSLKSCFVIALILAMI